MRRDLPDFFYVEAHHLVIHDRLNNWARYVQGRGSHWQSPIWKLGKSNGRQWSQPEIKDHINTLDGHVIEKAVGMLPDAHRFALRWCYVIKTPPSHARRVLAVTNEHLLRLISDGRCMLRNRLESPAKQQGH